METKPRIAFIKFFVIIALLSLTMQCSPKNNENLPSLENIPIKIGSVPAIVEGLSHIAFEEGFFTEKGLDASFTINPDGRSNLLQVISGELDIGGTMATPVIYQAVNGEDFKIIAKVQYQRSIHDGLGRIDHGITEDPQSLIGKNVAIMLGSSAHYHFDSWLLYNDIDISQLNIIDLPAPEGLAALENGEVDAMFYWFPFNEMARVSMGDNIASFLSDDLVPSSWVYVARTDFIEENPEVIEAFLSALLQAQELYETDPETAIIAHIKYSGLEESIVSSIFYEMDYQIVLDQALLSDMEYQTEWSQQEGYMESHEIPNFLDFVYPDALMRIRPSAVTILYE